MARIFLGLAAFSVLLLVVNIVLGLSIGDYQQAGRRYAAAVQRVDRVRRDLRGTDTDRQVTAREELAAAAKAFEPVRRRFGFHMLFGVAAGLVAVLINSITVTYFIGTARWCNEVVETYELDPQLGRRSTQLKRRTFPWSLGSILAVIVIVAFGAASDPAALPGSSATWATTHFACAILGTGFVAWSYLMQVGSIGANYEVIEEIIRRVNAIRDERGLDDAEARRAEAAEA